MDCSRAGTLKNAKSEVEMETKIKLSPKDLEKVFKSFSKNAGKSKLRHKYLPRAYYDTADLRLYKNNISLRVQYKPGEGGKTGFYEQTVKFELPHKQKLSRGTLLRKECKNLLTGPAPDLSTVSDRAAKRAVKAFQNKKLAHIFTAAIERRYFNIPVSEGAKKGVVEVAFDVGNIIITHNGRHYPFFEIEVEMKSGDPAAVDAITEKIMEIAKSAKVQPHSKSAQGSMIYKRFRRGI
jgi:inorganic triphosphatase YgiF